MKLTPEISGMYNPEAAINARPLVGISRGTFWRNWYVLGAILQTPNPKRRVKLMRSLPAGFKIDCAIFPGAHLQEDQVPGPVSYERGTPVLVRTSRRTRYLVLFLMSELPL